MIAGNYLLFERSKGHADDVAKSKTRRKYKYTRREIAPEEESPKFKSVISGLGGGKCFVVRDGRPTEDAEAVWEELLSAAKSKWSWYHQKQKVKRKAGVKVAWKKRQLKDRTKQGPSDKTGRKDTDVLRETIDLRPDHSRAVQYHLEAGKRVEVSSALSEIRAKKIQLFETIYDRRVLFVGEHDDSGQHHDDLWHCGTSEHETERVRSVPLRSYGESVGAASWARHFSAARDFGVDESALKELAGPTMDALEEDIAAATKQNREDPRDLRLLSELDKFAAQRLMAIDPGIVQRANGEYWDWIKANYRAGKIGVIKSREEVLDEEVTGLEKELSEIKVVLKPVADETLTDAAARVAARADGLDGFEKQAGELTIRAQVAEEDSTNAKTENQQLRDELEKSGKTISELLAEIAPLRILKDLVGKLIEALNKILLPPAVRSTIEKLLVEIGELVGKPFNSKSAEKRKRNEGPQI